MREQQEGGRSPAMCLLAYYTVLRQSREPTYLRLEMVRYARAQGIKPAARYFHTTVRTVRKWLRCWQPDSLAGLHDRHAAASSTADHPATTRSGARVEAPTAFRGGPPESNVTPVLSSVKERCVASGAKPGCCVANGASIKANRICAPSNNSGDCLSKPTLILKI